MTKRYRDYIISTINKRKVYNRWTIVGRTIPYRQTERKVFFGNYTVHAFKSKDN